MVNMTQIEIRCEYCGVEYDYSINKICPHCGGVASESHVTKAKKKALSREHTAGNAAASEVPTGKFMCYLVKLLPVWLMIILLSIVIPVIARSVIRNTAAENLQKIEEITYTDHAMNERFTTGIYDLTVLSARIVDDSPLCGFLPDGCALLAIKLSGTSRSSSYQDYSDSFGSSYNTPYVTDGNTCYRRVDEYSLINYEDSFAQNQFSFLGLRKEDPTTGYLCYIVKSDFEDLYLCLEEFETQNHTRHLTRVNRIRLEIGGDDNV